MDWSDWIALSSALIALIALGFSLVGYFKYDRPIKSLQKEKLQQEAIENKRANLRVSYSQVLIYNVLQIQNIGHIVAHNIVVELESEKDLAFEGMERQYKIEQLEPTEKSKSFAIIGDAPYNLKVKLTWDDESGERIKKNYYVDRQG